MNSTSDSYNLFSGTWNGTVKYVNRLQNNKQKTDTVSSQNTRIFTKVGTYDGTKKIMSPLLIITLPYFKNNHTTHKTWTVNIWNWQPKHCHALIRPLTAPGLTSWFFSKLTVVGGYRGYKKGVLYLILHLVTSSKRISNSQTRYTQKYLNIPEIWRENVSHSWLFWSIVALLSHWTATTT